MPAQRKRDSRTNGGSRSEKAKPEDSTLHSEPRKPDPRPALSREEIATLAYCYWEARGGQGGSAEEDWYRAERELLCRVAAQAQGHTRRRATPHATAG
jgi:hypothetical protein